LLEIVSQTDLLALVPEDTGESLRQAGRVEVHALPFKSPTFRLRQLWHKRYNDDAANRWLRELVRQLFASKE
jgi:DNA-binding transcriptional LysR family regulator